MAERLIFAAGLLVRALLAPLAALLVLAFWASLGCFCLWHAPPRVWLVFPLLLAAAAIAAPLAWLLCSLAFALGWRWTPEPLGVDRAGRLAVSPPWYGRFFRKAEA